VVYGWREGAKWGFFAPLYSLAGPQNRTYFDLSDSFRRVILGNRASRDADSRKPSLAPILMAQDRTAVPLSHFVFVIVKSY
jgi:hypothetical protein